MGHIITLSDITDSYNYARLMKKMTETDSLTGLSNRFAYEYQISELKKNEHLPDNLILFSIDINGLKSVNDSSGHGIGDSLIYDAAQCISNVMTQYGKCFRMGGDEFAAIITNDQANPLTIKKMIEENTKNYNNNNYKISISVGYGSYKDHRNMNIEELEKLADEMMYQEKENYYITQGVDRRAQYTAFSKICDSYLKVLKVNLTTESFEIIRMDIAEKNERCGFSRKISIWMHDFATSGMVYQDDVKEYLKKTDIEKLKDSFQNGKENIKIHYRRRVNDSYHNVMLEIVPEQEYNEKNQTVFLYVKDIE